MNKKGQSTNTIIVLVILIIAAIFYFNSLDPTPSESNETSSGSGSGGSSSGGGGGSSGGGSGNDDPSFTVSISKSLNSFFTFAIVCDGADCTSDVNEISFTIDITNNGGVDFDNIEVFNAESITGQLGTCTTNGLVSALQQGNMWGDLGALAQGEVISGETGRISTDDCLGSLSENTIEFKIDAKGTYGTNSLDKSASKVLTFKTEGQPALICDPSGWELAYAERVPSDIHIDESSTCFNRVGASYFTVPTTPNFCYEFRYSPLGTSRIDIDGHSWSEVDALAYVHLDTRSETWEAELNGLRCGSADAGKDSILPEGTGLFSSASCQWQCTTDSPGSQIALTEIDEGGAFFCAPNAHACTALDAFSNNCGTLCYGEDVQINIEEELRLEGLCTAESTSSTRAQCSPTEWAGFETAEWDYEVWRTPLIPE